MSYFGKNIRKIRSIKSLSQQEFGELFGLKRATLGAYEEERSEPKIETIIGIANYFSIPIDDLLKRELTVNEIAKFKEEFTLDSQKVNSHLLAEVPFISEDKIVDYLLKYDNEMFIRDLPKLVLPINAEKEFRALHISGLEMSNGVDGFYPKDIVIGEKIPKEAYNKLNSDSLVLVVKENDLLFRRYYTAKNKLVLRAYHRGVEDEYIDWNEIHEMWRIRYVFYKRLPKILFTTVEDKIQQLENQIKNLEVKKSK